MKEMSWKIYARPRHWKHLWRMPEIHTKAVPGRTQIHRGVCVVGVAVLSRASCRHEDTSEAVLALTRAGCPHPAQACDILPGELT